MRAGQSRRRSSFRRKNFGKPEEYITKRCRKTFALQCHSTENLLTGFYWKSLLIPEVFLAMNYLSDSRCLVIHIEVITKRRPKLFVSKKHFVRGPFLFFWKFLASKNYAKRGITIFHQKNCRTVPNMFVGNPFSVSENLWSRTFLCIKGVTTICYQNFFCLTLLKIFVQGTFRCFRILAWSWHKLHLHVLKKYASEINLKKLEKKVRKK